MRLRSKASGDEGVMKMRFSRDKVKIHFSSRK